MKPVLCLRNDRDDTLGITEEVLSKENVPVLRLDGFETSTSLPDLDQISALMVFGGEMNVDESGRYPWLLTQRHLMRQALEESLPVLGICLGAQMLARALDARVYQAPARELGFYPINVTSDGLDDPLLQTFQSGDRVFQWHKDTFDLPEGATLLASGDQVPVQAFRFGSNAWGVQFHFEVDHSGIEAWLRAAGPELVTEWRREPGRVRAEMEVYLGAQQERSRRLLTAFARLLSRRASGSRL